MAEEYWLVPNALLLCFNPQREQSGGSGKNSGGPRGRGKTDSNGGQKTSNRVLSGESGQSTFDLLLIN